MDSTKRCLFVTLEYPPFYGGVAQYTYGFVNSFPQDKAFVLVHSKNTRVEGNIVYDNFYTTLFPKWIGLYFLTKKIIKEKNIDYLITPHILPVGTVFLLLNKMIGIPYFISLHGLDILTAQKKFRKRLLAKKVLLNSKGIITNSTYTQKVVSRFLSPQHIRSLVLYPAPLLKPSSDTREFLRKKYTIPQENQVLITVCRLVPRKGIYNVLHAMKKILPDFPKLTYLIIGDGPEKQSLSRTINHLQLNSCVRMIQDVSQKTLSDYYSLADLFVMPVLESRSTDVEGFGLVFLEAGLAGLPVIGSKTGGIPDAIIERKTGLLIRPGNDSDLYESLCYLLQRRAKMLRYGAAGRAYAQTFTWESNYSLYSTWITSLL